MPYLSFDHHDDLPPGCLHRLRKASGLVDKPGTGVYSIGQHVRANTSKIPRADVADLMLNELEAGSLLQKAVTMTN